MPATPRLRFIKSLKPESRIEPLNQNTGAYFLESPDLEKKGSWTFKIWKFDPKTKSLKLAHRLQTQRERVEVIYVSEKRLVYMASPEEAGTRSSAIFELKGKKQTLLYKHGETGCQPILISTKSDLIYFIHGHFSNLEEKALRYLSYDPETNEVREVGSLPNEALQFIRSKEFTFYTEPEGAYKNRNLSPAIRWAGISYVVQFEKLGHCSFGTLCFRDKNGKLQLAFKNLKRTKSHYYALEGMFTPPVQTGPRDGIICSLVNAVWFTKKNNKDDRDLYRVFYRSVDGKVSEWTKLLFQKKPDFDNLVPHGYPIYSWQDYVFVFHEGYEFTEKAGKQCYAVNVFKFSPK